ncbi:shikimate kinase [Georgenia yuyongxinii]|uniref:Shikimate kinase n=1 Tax=Georgenia yuyongxinii TaxID=2589797 RepID=A0A552WJT0_9MICO|nr:shikimate kinase [Georgenia yuyongxinii]TRW43018.1 shikimate kinase [Georgenia yuyongxinii]
MSTPTENRPVTPSDGAGAPVLVLVGPPGAGKSTVGERLAAALDVPWTDTDAVLAEKAGRSIGELFIDVGEERFRELEHAVVAEAFAHPGILVLGSGAVEGGAELLEQYRAQGGTVVFLDVSLAAGMPRVGLNAPRTVTLGSPRAQFSSMAEQRRPLYARHATAVIDTSGLGIDTVVDAVGTLLDKKLM